MVEMLVPLIVTRSVVAPAVEPVVDAVPSSVDARRLTPLTRASEKGQRLTGEAHPGIYRVCAVITQAVRAAANQGSLLGRLVSPAAVFRFDHSDSAVHAHVEDDELVHTDVGQKDAGADAVVAED